MLRYTIHGKNKTSATVTLVIVRRKGAKKTAPPRDRYMAFVTNTSPSDVHKMIARIPKVYKRRWGIETGYRCAKQYRPFTCSRNPSVRLVLFYFTMIVYNIWAMINWFARQDNPDARPSVRPLIALYRVMEKILSICEKMIIKGHAGEPLFFMEDVK